MERDYRAAARVFKALCDPKRLAILEELRGGEKCACVLQEPMELTQSGLSYHMKVLCESGLVESRQEGKSSKKTQLGRLPAEQDGQGVCGEAAAGADYAGYRTGDTA